MSRNYPASMAPRNTRKATKVVIERVTQEKKKLRSVLSFRSEPPIGYTFIPAGNPDLTQALKDVARETGRKIYAVTTTPHQKTHELSKEVHRVGFHFPSDVVAEVCNKYGITLTRAGTVVGEQYNESKTRLRRNGKKWSLDDDYDQVTINTKAKDAIGDLFPNIPEQDLFIIIKTAFQKGQNKVGTAGELSLVRRAQLSVVAHIRHLYTDYDKLLRRVGYHEARSRVESPTLKKLVEWRGDDESGKKVLEDVMKEVVIVSDDDESSDEADDVQYVETHNVQDPYDPHSRPIRRLSPQPYDHHDLTEEGEIRFVPKVPVRKKQIGTRCVDETQHRVDAWERARQEYRANPTSIQPIIPLDEIPDRYYQRQSGLNYDFPPLEPKVQAERLPVSHQRVVSNPFVRDSPPVASTLVRGNDGYLYERIVTVPAPPPSHKPRVNTNPPSLNYAPPASDRVLRQNDRVVSQRYRDVGELPSAQNGNHTIVQSIEGPPLSPRSLRNLEVTEQVRSQQRMERVPPRTYSPIQANRPNADHLPANTRKRAYEEYEEPDFQPQPRQLRYITRAIDATTTSRNNNIESFDRNGYANRLEPLREVPRRSNYPVDTRPSDHVVYISSSPTRGDTDWNGGLRHAPPQAALSRLPIFTSKRQSLEPERRPLAISRVPSNQSRVQAAPEYSRYSTHEASNMPAPSYANSSQSRRQPFEGNYPTTEEPSLVRPIRYEPVEYLERPHERKHADPVYEPMPAQSSRHAQPGLLPYSTFAPDLSNTFATTVQPLNSAYDGSFDTRDMNHRQEPRKIARNDDVDFPNDQRYERRLPQEYIYY